jgi:hypothetical protein
MESLESNPNENEAVLEALLRRMGCRLARMPVHNKIRNARIVVARGLRLGLSKRMLGCPSATLDETGRSCE